ncbi:MAG: ATP synthase F1 subunit delta [Acidimicrobiaceae bacterium]|jgi:F-type H+-transporting ATPase subunit delta|nr:ATP synthase F1 subunit delta [Acidimicrobiaceae bacterium]MCH2615970.1 ATP synthase F1 subunit delta [Acidimicrobiales bacterium]MED5446317.1 ATP synthase F1 subunit delta [Actinomycetota bacterium]|tara:strand:- start:933 stop:1460 length:528 start_codon:yes stop_codon:yes gene_type:complete
MSDEKIQSYAQAILAVASAESNAAQIEDEIYRFSQVLQSSEELKSTLSDASIPSTRRQQIVEDLLDGQVTQTTVALVSMIVAAGMGGDIKAIADKVVGLGAESRDKAVAEVYSVVDLSSDQQQRLAAALKSATGKDVEMKVIIDESVMGGLLVQIEDEVIDGTVRTRLKQLREAF